MSIAQKLMSSHTVSEVKFSWWGSPRAVSKSVAKDMAEAVGAKPEWVNGRKRIVDRRHKVYAQLTALKGRISAYWKNNSLPFRDGQRLIKNDDVEKFVAQMTAYKAELAALAREFDDCRDEIIKAGEADLGAAFNGMDYPTDLSKLFDVGWAFPPVEPPAWLPPSVLEAEKLRVAAEFQVAMHRTVQEFASELHKSVTHLADCMETDPVTGKPIKKFHESALGNLETFFDKFGKLAVDGACAELQTAVDEAKKLTKGLTVKDLKADADLRAEIQASMGALGEKLEGLLVVKPTRKLTLKGKKEEEPAGELFAGAASA